MGQRAKEKLDTFWRSNGFDGNFPNYKLVIEFGVHYIEYQKSANKSGYFVNWGFQPSFLEFSSKIEDSSISASSCDLWRRLQVNAEKNHIIAPSLLDSKDSLELAKIFAIKCINDVGNIRDLVLDVTPDMLENGIFQKEFGGSFGRSALLLAVGKKYFGDIPAAIEVAKIGLANVSPNSFPGRRLREFLNIL